MKPLRLLTCRDYPRGTQDDQLLVEPLRRRGVAAEFVQWQHAGNSGIPHVLRSTWDYHNRIQEFQSALSALPLVFNSLDTVNWNADKRYLSDLSAAGLPVVPTRFGSLPELFSAAGDALYPCVVKPVGGAGGERTYRVQSSEQADLLLREPAAPETVWMRQPYLEKVTTEGEISILIAGSEVSHAVVKRPAPGNFLVHQEHGGRTESCTVDGELARLSLAALRAAPRPPVYARVDWLFGPEGPLLAELELVEPDLYLLHNSAAADRFAEVFSQCAA